MDHDNTGGTVSDSCVGCGHNYCDFDVILSRNFEERYNLLIGLLMYVMIILACLMYFVHLQH